jgi:hypothetical protein
MHQGDFDAFRTLLERLAKLYGKKLDDELVQMYWRALKDQSLTTVTERVESHIRYAKFFPKPFEIRPKDDAPEPTPDGKFEEGEERAMRNLEELRRMNPSEWMERMKGRKAAEYAMQFGIDNIWYDIPNRCWRHHA